MKKFISPELMDYDDLTDLRYALLMAVEEAVNYPLTFVGLIANKEVKTFVDPYESEFRDDIVEYVFMIRPVYEPIMSRPVSYVFETKEEMVNWYNSETWYNK